MGKWVWPLLFLGWPGARDAWALADGPAFIGDVRLVDRDLQVDGRLVLTLYWQGPRTKELTGRISYSPASNPQQRFVLTSALEAFNYLSSEEEDHVYRLELNPFPVLPVGGEGELTLELSFEERMLPPLSVHFSVVGDRGNSLVSPRVLRLRAHP